MILHEKYTALEERFNQGICHATRIECGLPKEPGLDCHEEPCRVVCPFHKMVMVL